MPLTLTDEQVAALREERARWQQDKQIAEGAQAIWNDPALSDRAKQLWKDKFPDSQISDYDLKKEIFSRLDAEKKEREDREKKAVEDAAKARFENQRAKVKEEYGFTDDAMTRMEAEMNERRVYDYEAMAPYFASKQPKPIESTSHNHFWNHHKSDTFKQIVADPEDYAFNEIVRAIQNDEQSRRSAR